LVEEEEDRVATVLPKVLAAKLTEGGRNRRAATRVIRVRERVRTRRGERKRGRSGSV
jgi:hypothetical protein